VTRVAQTGVPDEAYQAARSVFGEKELVDLTIANQFDECFQQDGNEFPQHTTCGNQKQS